MHLEVLNAAVTFYQECPGFVFAVHNPGIQMRPGRDATEPWSRGFELTEIGKMERRETPMHKPEKLFKIPALCMESTSSKDRMK